MILLSDDEIREVINTTDHYKDYFSSNNYELNIAKAQLKKVVEWAIEERQQLKLKKAKQKASNPKALANQIDLGAKMKTLQQVIDKCGGIINEEAAHSRMG